MVTPEQNDDADAIHRLRSVGPVQDGGDEGGNGYAARMTGAIPVTPQSISTSKRKEGEGFEVMVSVPCIVDPGTEDAMAWLYRASKSEQSVYLGDVKGYISTVKGGKKKDLTGVFVVRDPSQGELESLFSAVRNEATLDLHAAQGVLPLGG